MEQIFGITGGVGMGKSTLGDLLAQRGVAVVDTDLMARHLVEPGQPALAEIVQRFGPSILGCDNALDRQALARRVFSDHQARADLEAILHPRIHALWTAQVQRWRAAGPFSENVPRPQPPEEPAPIAFGAVIIPLLFETNSGPLFDATICAACSLATQTRRLSDRGWTAQQIQQRIQAQWPIEEKIALSHYVIWTDTPLDAVAAQLNVIFKRQTA